MVSHFFKIWSYSLETCYSGVLRVADYEYAVTFSKLKMVDPIWRQIFWNSNGFSHHFVVNYVTKFYLHWWSQSLLWICYSGAKSSFLPFVSFILSVCYYINFSFVYILWIMSRNFLRINDSDRFCYVCGKYCTSKGKYEISKFVKDVY